MADALADPIGAIRVLVADTDGLVVKTLCGMLTALGYQPIPCSNAAEAVGHLGDPTVGLAVVELHFGSTNGFELLRRFRFRSPELQIIMMSGELPLNAPLEAIRIGVAGYLLKPIDLHSLRNEVQRVLAFREAELRTRNDHANLQEELERRTQDVLRRQGLAIAYERSLITALCRLAEFRDPETGEHIHRMAEYCREIAIGLRQKPAYRARIDDLFVRRLEAAAPLHDIGKAGIPDAILLKRGPLTPAEFDIMKRHTTIGRDILQDVIRDIGIVTESDIISMGMEICRTHHERLDGKGYPAGLVAGEIPLVGRIVCVADFYDALSFPRIYRPYGLKHEEVLGMLHAGVGTQFDPEVVEAFLVREKEIVAIRARYTGEE